MKDRLREAAGKLTKQLNSPYPDLIACIAGGKELEAALASQPIDLRAKLEALRDKVANGIVSSQMREISGDYDSGATDVEIAVEAALTAIIEGKD